MRAMPLLIVMLIVAACSGTAPNPVGSSTSSTEAGPVIIAATTTTLPTTTTTDPTTTTTSAFARPDWLGTHLLPLRPDGHGEVQPTPAELVDRQLETVDLLDPPSSSQFESTIEAIPPAVLARSSWQEGCPVVSEDLRYLTMSHYGFDGELHTGEMIVNAAVAEDVAEVFARLHEARYPIEQMRVIRADEVDDQPTGDWNETTSFVCRPAVGSENWSQHAFGLAIDVNPFHNPYQRGDLVIPELASAYTDRDQMRPGMIFGGDVVVEAFADIGWTWGGDWSTLKDWMHFSLTGR
ncbi:MAG TPA: M15 family metallopeptidase [Acidimicrobiia bacterium]|nr:M15 family metallopeptidase [Acidimicrobiia bacterium]